jgi:hypothetical protein
MGMGSRLNPATGLCEFRWVLKTLNPSTTFRMVGLTDGTNVANTTGIFPDLAPNSVYLLTTDCRTDTVRTPSGVNPSLRVELLVRCTGQIAIQSFGGRDEMVCQQRYRDKYFLYDEQGNGLASNFTGLFDSLISGKWYEVRVQNPEGCFLGSVRQRATPYERPDLTATYGVICTVGQTTGNIRVTLRGGAPPYTYEMISPVGLRPPL